MRLLHKQLKRPNPGLFLAALLLCLWLMPGTSRGQSGGALSFDGIDDYIEVPNSASLNISSALTVEMWIKTSSTANAVLIEKSSDNTNYGLQLLASPNAGKVRFFISPDATTGQLTSNTAVNDGQWHHIAATFNDATNTMALYIDGVLDNSSNTKTASVTLNTQPLMIGARSGTLAFAGQIDEIRIWSRELCASEVLNNKSCELPAGQNGLVAIYDLNQGTAGGDNRGQTAPGAPSITSVAAGSGNVTVSFIAPVSDGNSPITSYTVISDPGGITATGASSPITVDGLTNGQPYAFSVTATNALGISPASAPSSATPTGVPTAPLNPIAVAASGQATVSFDAPASNGGLAITGYTVTSDPGGIIVTGTSSPLVVNGLSNGTGYTFTVTATNANGNSISSSVTAQVTPTGLPSAPLNAVATAGDAQATISFDAPATDGGLPVTSYTVTSTPGGLTATGASSPIAITGLTNGTSYTFSVTATNAAGTSPASSPSNSVLPVGPASAPTITSVVAGNAEATITFTQPTNNGGQPILSYTVVSSPGGITRTDAASPIVIFGLTNGQSYTFTVFATTAAGNGDTSVASSPGVIPLGPPGAPTITGVTVGNHQATVSFNAPASNGGSAIVTYTATAYPGGISNTGSTPSITINGLANGQTYTITVTATNTVGVGVPSEASQPVVPLGAPTSPTITSVLSGDSELTVDFDSSSNGGSPITGYTVIASSSAGSVTQPGNSRSIVVKGLINGISYSVTVTATNRFGTSAPSAAVNGTPKGRPLAPTIGEVVGGNAQATVSFTPPSLDGGSPVLDYTVVSEPGGFSQVGVSSPITVTGLANGQSYRFTVQARNAFGLGAKSALSAVVIPATIPSKPQILAASPLDAAASISFSLATDNGGSAITNYYITAEPGDIVQAATTSPYIFTGLINGVSYTFTMTAVNALGSSVSSDASDVVIPTGPTVTAEWRIAIQNDVLGANVDPLTGNAVNDNGSEYDPGTGAIVLPASNPNLPVAYFGNDTWILTLNPETGELTTMNYTTVDLNTFEERDFSGNLVRQLDPAVPIYYVTSTGSVVYWNDSGFDQLNPYTGNTLASGEAFDIAPTPVKFRPGYNGQ
jgi:hypothetical protein